jgi:hypothetical protein
VPTYAIEVVAGVLAIEVTSSVLDVTSDLVLGVIELGELCEESELSNRKKRSAQTISKQHHESRNGMKLQTNMQPCLDMGCASFSCHETPDLFVLQLGCLNQTPSHATTSPLDQQPNWDSPFGQWTPRMAIGQVFHCSPFWEMGIGKAVCLS